MVRDTHLQLVWDSKTADTNQVRETKQQGHNPTEVGMYAQKLICQEAGATGAENCMQAQRYLQ